MFEGLRRTAKVDAEPNLIPVMNLFVAMIPFLLLAVAFFQVGVIPATLPTHTENTSDIEPSAKAVTVSLVINDEGFALTAMNQSLSEEVLNSLARTIPKKNGQFALDDLQEALLSIQRRYAKSDTIVILPDERLGYGELVRIMDVVRYSGEGSKRSGLFPNLVLSRMIQE